MDSHNTLDVAGTMTERTRRAALNVVMAIAVAGVAAGLGLAAAPTPASAEPMMSGYTCYQYDVCMPGSAPCCFEVIEIIPGEGRCSTMC